MAIGPMTHEEIEARRRELQDILERHENKALNAVDTRHALHDLAKQVGASTQAVFLNVVQGGSRKVSEAEICELAYNIHQALQTASMIDACRTAAKNHEIALAAMKETSESQRISKHMMKAAWVAATAAWAAVVLPPAARLIWEWIVGQP